MPVRQDDNDRCICERSAFLLLANFYSNIDAKSRYGVLIDYCDAYEVALASHGSRYVLLAPVRCYIIEDS